MKLKDLKTIDITTLTWFDRINGNTYFAQKITLNYGLENSEIIKNNFQYGYSSFPYFALQLLQRDVFDEFSDVYEFNKYLNDNNIIVRSNTHNNCKKRELINI